MKQISLQIIRYCAEPYNQRKNRIEFELDQSNYGTTYDSNSAPVINTSKFATKTELSTLKSDID